jgi:acyl carrier protein
MVDPRASRILDIVAKETFVDREKLVPDATIDELGIASLDIVQAVFAIESAFSIDIPIAGQGAGLEFSTVKSLVDHVIGVMDRGAAERPAAAP